MLFRSEEDGRRLRNWSAYIYNVKEAEGFRTREKEHGGKEKKGGDRKAMAMVTTKRTRWKEKKGRGDRKPMATVKTKRTRWKEKKGQGDRKSMAT